MLPFGVTIPATVPQRSEIPEGLMNNPVYYRIKELCIMLVIKTRHAHFREINVVRLALHILVTKVGILIKNYLPN
jgi:hypothetical protein